MQEAAGGFLNSQAQNTDFCLCELVLIELYVLLRNPAVVERPLSAARAVEICMTYRENRHWRIIDYPGNLMSRVWDPLQETS